MNANPRNQMTPERTAAMDRVARKCVVNSWHEDGHQYADRAAFVREWAQKIPASLAYINGERLRFTEEAIASWLDEYAPNKKRQELTLGDELR